MHKEMEQSVYDSLQPVSPGLTSEIAETAGIFGQKLGPDSAIFVKNLILEKNPQYGKLSQAEIEKAVSEKNVSFRLLAEEDPSRLLPLTYDKIQALILQIEQAKGEASAKGIGEQIDKNLGKLGKEMVFTHRVIGEISKKYPRKFLDFVEKRKKRN